MTSCMQPKIEGATFTKVVLDEMAEAERKAMAQPAIGYVHIDGGVQFFKNESEPKEKARTPRNRHERRVACALNRRKEPPGKRRQ